MATVGHSRPRAPAGFEARPTAPWVSPDPRLVLAFWNPGGVLVFYCFNLLLCSHFNFLHLMKCQDGIGSCKMPLLQIDRMVGALFY
jgi:hypothetical protein